MHRITTTLAIGLLAGLVAGCAQDGVVPGENRGTPNTVPVDLEQVENVLEAVREGSPEVAAFIDEIEWAPEPLQYDGDVVHLLLRFEEPIPGRGIWDRTCEATEGLVSGAHFVVNVANESLLDMSPRWGPDSCIPLPTGE